MNISEWTAIVALTITVLGGFVSVATALWRHAKLDGKREAKLNELARRISAVDGIDANGD